LWLWFPLRLGLWLPLWLPLFLPTLLLPLVLLLLLLVLCWFPELWSSPPLPPLQPGAQWPPELQVALPPLPPGPPSPGSFLGGRPIADELANGVVDAAWTLDIQKGWAVWCELSAGEGAGVSTAACAIPAWIPAIPNSTAALVETMAARRSWRCIDLTFPESFLW
jgi:hypothetical protein